MATTLTSKGQIVIPAEIRKKFDLKPGTKISVIEEDGKIILYPQGMNALKSLRGIISFDALSDLKKMKEEEQKNEASRF